MDGPPEAAWLRLRIEALEVERNVYESGLRMISTAGPIDPADDWGRAYVAAGGGYEGLQAIAQRALALGKALLGQRDPPEVVRGSLPERETADPCAGCGSPIQPGQAWVEGPRHLGC